MIGLNKTQVQSYTRTNGFECYLIEERQLHDAEPSAYTDIPVEELRFAAYQQSLDAVAVAAEWDQDVNFDAVLPGLEYAVPAAAAIAERLGLRFPGRQAVDAFTHKAHLRDALRGTGVHQPRAARAASADDIRSFYADGPVVLKPANRQASVGVVRIDEPGDIDAAWAFASSADEGWRTVDRPFAWDFVVEDFLGGSQFSVESIVADGRCEFHNVTQALTFSDSAFSELQHLVPGAVPGQLRADLCSATEEMFAALAVEDGFFHSEWKVIDGRPYLLECAARAAGDSIPELIERAYGFDPYVAYVNVLSGRPSGCVQQARRVAGIRFFHPEPGVFDRVVGRDWADANEHIFEFFVKLAPGDVVPDFKNSWSRAGCFAFEVPTHAEAINLLEEADRRIALVVREEHRASHHEGLVSHR